MERWNEQGPASSAGRSFLKRRIIGMVWILVGIAGKTLRLLASGVKESASYSGDLFPSVCLLLRRGILQSCFPEFGRDATWQRKL